MQATDNEYHTWGYSSAGRAPALQAGGQRFDPAYLHHIYFRIFRKRIVVFFENCIEKKSSKSQRIHLETKVSRKPRSGENRSSY